MPYSLPSNALLTLHCFKRLFYYFYFHECSMTHSHTWAIVGYLKQHVGVRPSSLALIHRIHSSLINVKCLVIDTFSGCKWFVILPGITAIFVSSFCTLSLITIILMERNRSHTRGKAFFSLRRHQNILTKHYLAKIWLPLYPFSPLDGCEQNLRMETFGFYWSFYLENKQRWQLCSICTTQWNYNVLEFLMSRRPYTYGFGPFNIQCSMWYRIW